MIKEIELRRSRRIFDKDYDIDNETIEDIIKAAALAPSAKNYQPWKFYVLKRRSKKEFIDYLRKYIDNPESHYVYISDRVINRSMKMIEDCSAIVFVFNTNSKRKNFKINNDLNSNIKSDQEGFEKAVIYTNDLMDKLSIGCALQNLMLVATEKGIDNICFGFGNYFLTEIYKYFNEESEFITSVALGKGVDPVFPIPKKNISEILTIKE